MAVADRAPWLGVRPALPPDYEIVFADTARDALDRLAKPASSFGAVVAELRVPGMSGLDLLQAVRQHMPDVARILVGGPDDHDAPIVAINEVRVLAYFVAPFSPDDVAAAIREGVTRCQRRQHLHAVSTHLAEGVIQMLTGSVHPTNVPPEIPEAAKALRDRVRQTAQAMKLPTIADLETAALLSHVALASVPHHILDKLQTHLRLAPTESDFLARLPDVGLRLVEALPRLAGVADIFRHQGAAPGPMVVREDGVREAKVPLASRILRAVFDLQLYENSGLNTVAALAVMRRQAANYDSGVLKALERLFGVERRPTNPAFEEFMVADLMPGWVLATDALSHEGVPLVAAGTALSAAVLDRLQNFAELGEVEEPIYVLRDSIDTPAAET